MVKRVALVCLFLMAGLIIPAQWISFVQGGILPEVALDLSLTTVAPESGLNNLDVTITITGTGFPAVEPAPQVILSNETGGVIPLGGITLISETQIEAVVPWGLAAGVYTLKVVNPDLTEAGLAGAYTVIHGMGAWTTDGPYGGQVGDIAVNPANGEQVFITAWGSGIYSTSDGGDHWQPVFNDQAVRGVSYGFDATPNLYYWGGRGLYRSSNDGATWEQIFSGGAQGFAEDPSNPSVLWIAGMNGEVWRTSNGGAQWTKKRDALPDAQGARRVAVDPSNSQTIYIGLENGLIYKSVDGGESWENKSVGLPAAVPTGNYPVYILFINPASPQTIIMNHWQEGNYHPAFISKNGGESWTSVTLTSSRPQPNDMLSDISAVGSTLYASLMAEFWWAKSTDGGETWQAFTDRDCDYTLAIGVDPVTQQPRYLGGGASGVMRSADNGASWQFASDGITGLPIMQVAASPADPGTIFVAAEHAGAFVSHSGGLSWERQTMSFCGSFAVSAIPAQARKATIGSANSIFRNPLVDDLWERTQISSPFNTDDNLMILAVEPAPSDSKVIYIGGRAALHNNPSDLVGIIYKSSDGGATFHSIQGNLPANAAPVSDIAVHPTQPEVLYAALTSGRGGGTTLEEGLFRSQDGGTTWVKVSPAEVAARSVVFDPFDPATIYMGGSLVGNRESGTVYISTDSGASWDASNLNSLYDWGWPDFIAPLPNARGIIYVGSEQGLFRTTNGGASWSRSSGELGRVTITGLAVVEEGDRSILYVGTVGGFPVNTGSLPVGLGVVVPYVKGGVYQFTATWQQIFLPSVRK